MDGDKAEWELEDTTAMWERRVEERLQELQAELEVNAKLNGVLAQASGLTRSKLPKKARRKMEELAKRVSAADPPPISMD